MENSRSSLNEQVDTFGEISREITNLDAQHQVGNAAPLRSSDISGKTPIHLPNEVLNLIWSHIYIIEQRNVTVRCKKVGESFELWSNEPYSVALRVCRQSRQWFIDQHRDKQYNVAALAQIGGYVGPLNPLKNLWFNPQIDRICPIIEGDWSDEAFITMCNVMQVTKVDNFAVSDCSHESAIYSPWAAYYRLSNIDNWSLSFKEVMIYTTKSDINENRQLKLVEWKDGDVKLDTLQEKRRRIQTNYKALQTFKKVSEAYADQRIADAQANLKGNIARKVSNLPIWLYQNREEWEGLNLQIMVEAGALNRQQDYSAGNESSDCDDNDDRGTGYAESQNDEEVSEEDEDEEPEEDEGITDDNSDDDIEN
ncbi:uncharacterized protein EAF01_009559 [Botrytis porri]|uniref:2EXR domain-containing protein n=1 Tax=Botrytis porri TaxID=87229 RepID=A0A4Z1K938_9HELO|nr:uncharacterized protein EAF01_009559 [Botrytis porri]KAF7895597.1 hypothetical protein EAF01_009559 [Botrytis porri]TGO81986.1 hypothetical protein BPOR_0953g00010 [Botrytis porri]